jgi:hypothetical protein
MGELLKINGQLILKIVLVGCFRQNSPKEEIVGSVERVLARSFGSIKDHMVPAQIKGS